MRGKGGLKRTKAGRTKGTLAKGRPQQRPQQPIELNVRYVRDHRSIARKRMRHHER